MNRHTLIAVLVTLVLSSAARSETPPIQIPQPVSLDSVEESVRSQLVDLRNQVARLASADPSGQQTAVALGLLGEAYLAYTFLEPAQQCFSLASQLLTDSFRSNYLLGYAYEQSGLLIEATAALRTALSQRPSDVPTMCD